MHVKAPVMPWLEPVTDQDQLRWCIRSLVALSTLPAAWQNYDTRQIGDSVLAALISILDADFVFIALPRPGNQLVIELNRSNPRLDPAGRARAHGTAA
jgi:two-component system, LuxR family, sensor kinase FixL